MSHKDPTEDVLAAIASIFDKDKSETPLAAELPGDDHEALADQPHEPAAQPRAAAPPEIDGYCKSGPGPLDAIRFKWTARRDDNGDFFVDETIGVHSRPMVNGPMPEDEVIAFIDTQVREAHERFDRLKDDMTIRSPEAQAAKIAVDRAHAEHDASGDQGF